MNKFVKSILTFSITTALGLSVAHAATYEVIDKGAAEKLKYTYSQQENNFGEMALSGTTVYNFPVQYQYLDEDDFDSIVRLADRTHESVHELEDIEDEAALRAGTPTANDLSWVKMFLQSQSSPLYQKVGDIIAMTNFGGDTKEFTVFDQKFEDTDTLTYSTVDFVNGITDEGWIFGNASAPYLPMPFVDSSDEALTYWVREFNTRGYFSPDKGETIIPLMPPESLYGGESAIFDISNSRIAVGYASIGIKQGALDYIDDTTGGCADEGKLEDQPVEVCIQQISSNMYNTEAFKWTLNESGQLEAEELGHLVTPHVDDERELVSIAQAVNTHGVAVGFATGWWDETELEPTKNESSHLYAVVFKDGEVKDFTEDHSKHFNSKAYDISDAGIAVGSVDTYINGAVRQKFYYVDTNDINAMEMILPNDFFNGSSSTAYAINEHGMVVGDGEVETHNVSQGNPRRTHGFIYDTNTDTFTDLNSYLPCNSAYTIIEARDINENNEVSATAIIKVSRRDSKGELMYDSDGVLLVEDVVRAVKLSPIAGEIEDCSKVEEKVERKGAGFGMLSLFFLSLLGFARRGFTQN